MTRALALALVGGAVALSSSTASAATYEVRASYSEINWDRQYSPRHWRLDKYDAIEGTSRVAQHRIGRFAEAQAKCRKRGKRRATCRWEAFDSEQGGVEGTAKVRLIRRGWKLFMRIKMPKPTPCEPKDYDADNDADAPYDRECSTLNEGDGATQVD